MITPLMRFVVGVMTLGLAATPGALSRTFGIDIYILYAIFVAIGIFAYKANESFIPLNNSFLGVTLFLYTIALSKAGLSDKEISFLLTFLGIIGFLLMAMCFSKVPNKQKYLPINFPIYFIILILSMALRKKFPVSFEICFLFFATYTTCRAVNIICSRASR